MKREIAVSVVHQRSDKKFYHGFFIVCENDLDLLKEKNPKVELKDDLNAEGNYFCYFNDFELRVKSEDEKIIKSLRDNNMDSSAYDVIKILDGTIPNWRNE